MAVKAIQCEIHSSHVTTPGYTVHNARSPRVLWHQHLITIKVKVKPTPHNGGYKVRWQVSCITVMILQLWHIMCCITQLNEGDYRKQQSCSVFPICIYSPLLVRMMMILNRGPNWTEPICLNSYTHTPNTCTETHKFIQTVCSQDLQWSLFQSTGSKAQKDHVWVTQDLSSPSWSLCVCVCFTIYLSVFQVFA